MSADPSLRKNPLHGNGYEENGISHLEGISSAKGTCTVDGCANPRRASIGYCGMHYQRWVKHGTTDELPKRQQFEMCAAAGCDLPPRSRTSGICEMHYGRLRRNGTLENLPEPTPRKRYDGYVMDRGQYQHRAVFFAANGKGPFRCRWCRKPVSGRKLHVDHLDDVKDNNVPANLVPSCFPCNVKRGAAKRDATVRRTAKMLIHKGEAMMAADWAARRGMSTSVLHWRLAHGWSLTAALDRPVAKRVSRRSAA